MNARRHAAGFIVLALFAAGCGARTGLLVPDSGDASFDDGPAFDDGPTFDDGPAADDGQRPEVFTPPENIDCSLRVNCPHAACRSNPVCDSWVPGGCPMGQVHDAQTNLCRPCNAGDCDGLPSFCCITSVCANAAACGLYLCAPIARSCGGLTSQICGIYDIDEDDAWGDCDEAVSDNCCACHVAVGCRDSACMFGQYVSRNDCADCTASDCDEISCMGLHGCPTRCARDSFFDGAHCRSCNTSGNRDLIPACRQ